MSEALLRVENVHREFDGGRVRPLRGVNLTVWENACLAILGKSGSGKSSLIHIMGGCDLPTSGQVLWRGSAVQSQDAWRRLRATQIGIVFQEFLLLPALTAIENVEMALLANGMGATARRRRSEALLERVGLKDRFHHLPNALSGGERQRVAIARALVRDPAAYLMDDPISALDARLREETRVELKRIQR